jgi:hypothetical protein
MHLSEFRVLIAYNTVRDQEDQEFGEIKFPQ